MSIIQSIKGVYAQVDVYEDRVIINRSVLGNFYKKIDENYYFSKPYPSGKTSTPYLCLASDGTTFYDVPGKLKHL